MLILDLSICLKILFFYDKTLKLIKVFFQLAIFQSECKAKEFPIITLLLQPLTQFLPDLHMPGKIDFFPNLMGRTLDRIVVGMTKPVLSRFFL